LNKFKIGLIYLATTLLSGCFRDNQKLPNQFFVGEFGGIHPAKSYEDKDAGYLHLLDSAGIKIHSFNVEIDSVVCNDFRPRLGIDSVPRAPNRFVVGEAEVKKTESEITGNDTIIFTKIVKARAINPELVSNWKTRVDSANKFGNGQNLFER
jgi:hypothetical protein